MPTLGRVLVLVGGLAPLAMCAAGCGEKGGRTVVAGAPTGGVAGAATAGGTGGGATPAPAPVPAPQPQPPVAVGPPPIPITAANLARGPYLQDVRAASAVVIWRTRAPTDGTVHYGPTPALGLSVAGPASVIEHALTLTGLAPDTRYYYQVESGGARLAPVGEIRTAPVGATDFDFVAFGDCGTGSAEQKALAARMLQLQVPVAALTGDLVYPFSAPADWDPHFFEPYAELMRSTCFFATRGNHDLLPAGFLEAFQTPANNPQRDELYYSWDYGDVHFVALDSAVGFFLPGSAQVQWLERDLAGTTKTWKVVYWHHPPFSSGSHGSNLAIRYLVSPILESYRVDLVLTGHDHNYERTNPVSTRSTLPGLVSWIFGKHEITYVVTGGGGTKLRGVGTGQSFTASLASEYHFLLVKVRGRRLECEAQRADGSVIDRFALTK